MVHFSHLLGGQRSGVLCRPWLACVLCYTLHHLRLHQHWCADVTAKEIGGRRARWAQNAKGSDFSVVHRFVASLHHILQPRGLLSHHRLLRTEKTYRLNKHTYTLTLMAFRLNEFCENCERNVRSTVYSMVICT